MKPLQIQALRHDAAVMQAASAKVADLLDAEVLSTLDVVRAMTADDERGEQQATEGGDP